MWIAPATATGGTRTRNLRFTKPLLCQLSYGGICAKCRPINGLRKRIAHISRVSAVRRDAATRIELAYFSMARVRHNWRRNRLRVARASRLQPEAIANPDLRADVSGLRRVRFEFLAELAHKDAEVV